MSEPRDVIAQRLKRMWDEDDDTWGWWDDEADAILAALADAGYVVAPKAAIQFVMDECSYPDKQYWNMIDGEWLYRHMRHMLNGDTPDAPPPPNGKLVATKPKL